MMVRDEPIGPALDDDEGEARRSRYPYSILEQVELIETDAYHGCISKDDHVSFANRDLFAAFGSGFEIFANCLTPHIELGARYAVQEGVGRIELHDRVRIVRAEGGRPSIDQSACVLGRTGKCMHRPQYQQRGKYNL